MYRDLPFFCGILCLFLLLHPLFSNNPISSHSQNARMDEVGRTSWSIWSISAPEGHPEQGAEAHMQPDSENPQGGDSTACWGNLCQCSIPFLLFSLPSQYSLVLVPSLYKQIYTVPSLHQSVPPYSISNFLYDPAAVWYSLPPLTSLAAFTLNRNEHILLENSSFILT